MAYQKHTIETFAGGMSDSERTGIQDSSNLLQSLNIHEDPSYLTLNQSPAKISSTVVTDLVMDFTNGRPYDTNIYAIGNTGNIYKINNSFAVSLDHTISAGTPTGQGIFVWQNYLYYASSATLGRKGRLNNSPSYSGSYVGDDFLSDGTINLDQSQSLTGQTYTLPSSISETATNLYKFAPPNNLLKDPIKEIDIKLASTGTGNWTLTLHDSFNTIVGTATVANGSLVGAGSYQPFIFSTPLRIIPDGSYHMHLTSSDGTGTVTTGTTSDFSTVNFNEYFGILIGSPDFHPMQTMAGVMAIGNDNYIATWDGFTYLPNVITLDAGFSARSMHIEDQYIVTEATKEGSDGLVEEGRIYYWDGVQSSFNYSYELRDGKPQTAASYKNRTFHILGAQGDLYMGVEPLQKIQNMNPWLGRGKTINIAPGGMKQWGSRLYMAIGSSTNDPNMIQGVFSFGNSSDKLPEVFQYDIVPSHGQSKGTTLSMGGLVGFQNYMFYGWGNNGTYGIDLIDRAANPNSSGTWQSLIIDGGDPQKQDLWLDFVITFEPLPADCTVQAQYQLDRAGSFTNGTLVNGALGTFTQCRTAINARAREIQFAFVLTGASVYPRITGLWYSWDGLEEEVDFS